MKDSILTFTLSKAGFSDVQLDGLKEVINSSKNPVYALELILGLYEAPKAIPTYTYQKSNDGKLTLCTFISYDPWEDRVKYSYDYEDTVRYHFLKDSGVTPTSKNYEDLKKASTHDYKHYMKEEEKKNYEEEPTVLKIWKTRTDSIHLSTWLDREEPTYPTHEELGLV